jgi:Zn-dependent protease with chaperone function
MLYALFLILAIVYNIRKFKKERKEFLSSIIEASTQSHREMILSHHFYVFIFEGFLSIIVAHLLSEKAIAIGIIGLGAIYLCLVFMGFFLYQFFIRYIEKHTQLALYQSFKNHLIKELRVNFAMVLLPILVYASINWAFQDDGLNLAGGLWIFELFLNIIFVSVLTIVCSVIIMLRLIPNREINEPEYLQIINKRLTEIQQPKMRVRWIEADIKNAFVVGLKLLFFSNQTMFIGKSLRDSLTLEEFDAIIAHELGHVVNRHIHKRVIDLLKNIVSLLFGTLIIAFSVFIISFLYWGEDAYLHSYSTAVITTVLCMIWYFFNHSMMFDTIRSHEFEADGYAVMVMGADLEAFKSALTKLTSSEELPQYLKLKYKIDKKKGRMSKWISEKFSTHPDPQKRISYLEHKISTGLPFNHYVSTPQKIRIFLSHLFDWRVSVPGLTSLVAISVWAFLELKIGQENIAFIEKASSEEILKNEKILLKINDRPQIVGQTLMYYVVKKKDHQLIEFFMNKGADKGKTLIYISQLKDYDLLKKYYTLYQSKLSEDDYFLVLRKAAEVNFTDGYRLLVNAKQFEKLDPNYKEDVSRLYQTNTKRMPASVSVPESK